MPDSMITQAVSGAPAVATDCLPIGRPGLALPRKLTLAEVLALAPMENAIINGGFDISQRVPNAPVALTTSFAYYVDRWAARQTVSAQATFGQGSAGVSNRARLSGIITLTGTSTGTIEIIQVLESVDSVRFQDKKARLRLTCVKGSTWNPPNLSAVVYYSTTLSDSPASGLGGAGWSSLGGVVAPTTGWANYSVDVTLPAGVTQVGILFGAVPTGAAVDANSWLRITNVSLTEVDAEPLLVSRRPYALELALCQRYYQKSFQLLTAPAQNAGTTGAEVVMQAVAAGTTLGAWILLPARMRVAPTVTLYNPSAANAEMRNASIGADCTGTAAAFQSERGFRLTAAAAPGSGAGGTNLIHWAANSEL